MQPPGHCFDYATPTLGSVHNFLSGSFGLLLSSVGLGGLLAMFLLVREAGLLRAVGRGCAALALGVLVTFATRYVSTTVQCEAINGNHVHLSSVPEVRSGFPAYFKVTQLDSSDSTELLASLLVNIFFWSGLAAFILVKVGNRAPRAPAGEIRATARFGRRSRTRQPPASTGT